MATERGERELAALRPAERAATPPLIPLYTLTDAVVTLIERDDLAGRVMFLLPGEQPRLAEPS